MHQIKEPVVLVISTMHSSILCVKFIDLTYIIQAKDLINYLKKAYCSHINTYTSSTRGRYRNKRELSPHLDQKIPLRKKSEESNSPRRSRLHMERCGAHRKKGALSSFGKDAFRSWNKTFPPNGKLV